MTKNVSFGTDSNHIDFSNPPAGKRYCPMPINKEQIIEWGLDPRYVVWHKFSGTLKLCYMVSCNEEIAKEYIQTEKTECKKLEREKRCIIPSPITGKPICCPDTNSCKGCEYAVIDNVSKVGAISYEKLSEDEGYERGTRDLTSDEAMTNIMTEEILAELSSINEQLAQILKLRLKGYEIKEICEVLGIKKSTLHDNMKKIATIVNKHLRH